MNNHKIIPKYYCLDLCDKKDVRKFASIGKMLYFCEQLTPLVDRVENNDDILNKAIGIICHLLRGY